MITKAVDHAIAIIFDLAEIALSRLKVQIKSPPGA
jgi:hypothetical protein